MALQYSVAVRDAMNDTMESTIGTAPTLEIRTGAVPANCAAADSGSVLVSVTLPSDWLAASSSGAKAKAGTWSNTASGTGTAGHFRIKAGATCHIQGTITATAGGGDMTLDSTSITSGQTFTVNSYSVTRANA